MADEPRPLHRAYNAPARIAILDTLLANPDESFNRLELAGRADVSEWAANQHPDVLLELDLAETVEGDRGVREFTLADTEIAELAQRFRDAHREKFELLDDKTDKAVRDFYG